MEIFKTEKILFLLFQGKGESLDSYTRNFKALLKTAKKSDISPRRCDEMAKITRATDGGNWDALTASGANQTVQDKVK